MCGLLGIIGPGIDKYDLQILEDMARVSLLRGKGGTGLLQGEKKYKNREGDVLMWKTKEDVNRFLDFHFHHKDGDARVLNYPDFHEFYCMHVRAPTIGNVTDENAHPFVLDKIIGMHNGTLKDKKYWDKDKTDSEMMFVDMQERGIKTVLEDLEYDSAWAIVVYDKETKEFTIGRNNLRPLHLAINPDRRVMYYASELLMLKWILDRNEVTPEKYYRFGENTLHTFKVGDIRAKDVPNWKIEQVTPPAKPAPKPVIVHQDNKKKVKIKANVRKGAKNLSQFLLPEEWNNPKTPNGNVKQSALHQVCGYCYKDMDLLEQYQGVQVNAFSWLCNECSEITNQIYT